MFRKSLSIKRYSIKEQHNTSLKFIILFGTDDWYCFYTYYHETLWETVQKLVASFSHLLDSFDRRIESNLLNCVWPFK